MRGGVDIGKMKTKMAAKTVMRQIRHVKRLGFLLKKPTKCAPNGRVIMSKLPR